MTSDMLARPAAAEQIIVKNKSFYMAEAEMTNVQQDHMPPPPQWVHALALMLALPSNASGPWAQSCSHSSWRSANGFAALTGRIVSLFNVGGGASFILSPVHLYWLWWQMGSAIQTAVAPYVTNCLSFDLMFLSTCFTLI